MTESIGSERVEKFLKTLRGWQFIERRAVGVTAEVSESTKNPLVRLIMQIIQHDSLMHHRVQQFLIDNVNTTLAVSREDVAAIWEKIEEHDKMEKKTIELAGELREQAWSPVHKQLLDYLLFDETKHDKLLDGLNELKKGMSQASGG